MPANDEFPVDIVFTSEVALNANIVTPCLTRALASPLECALTKNASANPLEYAPTNSLDLKFLRMNSYKKRVGEGGGTVLICSAGLQAGTPPPLRNHAPGILWKPGRGMRQRTSLVTSRKRENELKAVNGGKQGQGWNTEGPWEFVSGKMLGPGGHPVELVLLPSDRLGRAQYRSWRRTCQLRLAEQQGPRRRSFLPGLLEKVLLPHWAQLGLRQSRPTILLFTRSMRHG